MLVYFLYLLVLVAAYIEQEFMALPNLQNPTYNFLFTEDKSLLQAGISSEIISLNYDNETIKCIIPPAKALDPPQPIKDEKLIAQARNVLSSLESRVTILLDDVWGWMIAFDNGIIQFLPKYENGEAMMVPTNFKVTVGKPGRSAGHNLRTAEPVVVKGKHMMRMIYSNGTFCDISGQPRTTKIYFTCSQEINGSDDRGVLLVSVDEPYSCVYELVLGITGLCDIPEFKNEPDFSLNQIICGLDSDGPTSDDKNSTQSIDIPEPLEISTTLNESEPINDPIEGQVILNDQNISSKNTESNNVLHIEL